MSSQQPQSGSTETSRSGSANQPLNRTPSVRDNASSNSIISDIDTLRETSGEKHNEIRQSPTIDGESGQKTQPFIDLLENTLERQQTSLEEVQANITDHRNELRELDRRLGNIEGVEQRVSTLEDVVEEEMESDTATTQLVKTEVLESLTRILTISMGGIAVLGLLLSLIVGSASFAVLFIMGLLFLGYTYRVTPDLFRDE